MTFGVLALTIAALFSGAAFYVGFVEHPARSLLDDRAQLAQWKPAYARGAVMQASLAAAGFALGAVAWWATSDLRWLVGSLILLANWPYTLLVMLPTNHQLEAISPSEAGPMSRALLARWSRLHAVRTALGLAATAVFVWTALG